MSQVGVRANCGRGGRPPTARLASRRSTYPPRYGAITFGNVQKSIPASFGARAPVMVRKIAVRRAAQVSGTAPGPAASSCGRHAAGTHGALRVFLRPSQVFYNNKGYHSMPTYLNSLNNAILRDNLPRSKGNPAAYGEPGWAGLGWGPGRVGMEQVPEAALPCLQASPSPTTP